MSPASQRRPARHVPSLTAPALPSFPQLHSAGPPPFLRLFGVQLYAHVPSLTGSGPPPALWDPAFLSQLMSTALRGHAPQNLAFKGPSRCSSRGTALRSRSLSLNGFFPPLMSGGMSHDRKGKTRRGKQPAVHRHADNQRAVRSNSSNPLKYDNRATNYEMNVGDRMLLHFSTTKNLNLYRAGSYFEGD